MSLLTYDCGSVENTVTAILDTSTGSMLISGTGDIDNYADGSAPWYSDQENITQVTINKGVTRIGTGSFYGCESLSYVSIPNTVTSFGTNVFKECTSLKTIKIPKSVTNIGNYIFADSGIESVKFYGNPPSVGTDIFDNVTATCYIPEGNEEWDSLAKATVAGNGSTITWTEFDPKPSLLEYDELDYFWSKIKDYVDTHSSGGSTSVSYTPIVTSGVQLGTITINNINYTIYSPEFANLYDPNAGATGLVTVNYDTIYQSTTYNYDNGTENTYTTPFIIDDTKTDLNITVSKSGNYIDFNKTFSNIDTSHDYTVENVFNMPYLESAPSYNDSSSSSTEVRSGTYETDDIVIRCSSSFGEGQPWYLVRYGQNSSFFNTSRSDNGYPKWFEIYTSTAIIVKKFTLLPRQDSYGSSEYPKEFKLQGSNNGTDYTDIALYEQIDNVDTSGVFYTYECQTNTTAYKYHRLLVNSRMSGTDNVVSLSKFYLTEAYTSLEPSEGHIFPSNSKIAPRIMQVPLGSSSVPVYVNSSGIIAECTSLSLDTTGNAATASVADKVGTSTVGSSTEPVYINAGTPTACGGSLDVDITGNATSATDSTTVKELNGTSNYNRPILLSGLTNITTTTDNQTTPVYSNKFYANPSTGVQTATGGFSSTGSYTTSLTTSTHLAGNKGTALINSTAAKGYTMLARMKSTNGVFTHGVYNADYQFYYTADSVITAGTNSVTKTCLTINENGTVSAPNGFSGALTGNVTGNCSGSSGSCTGNAATATSATSATTATNANNAKLTHTVGNTEYPLVFGSSFVINDSQQALRIGTPSTTANQCPLRVKAYCAAANTQGEAYLVLGNALAKASANNARGGLAMYGTGTAYNFIKMNTVSTNGKTIFLNTANTADITLTLPSATGTIALTSSNISGSSASCTGNAATATSATTATNANNLKVTHTGAAWRDILSCATGFTSASNQAVYGHNSGSVAYYVDANATSGNQRAILRLGNATANTTAAGHNGQIWMYGTSTGYTCITPGYNSTSSITITLPSSTGTLALTSDITNSSALRNKFLGTHSDGVSWAEYGGKDNTEFKIKIVVPYSGSQNKQCTITWAEPFTTYCCALYCSSDGSNHVIGNSTSVANHLGGHFYGNSGVGHGWNGSALSLTSYKTPNSYIYMIIIVGV